MDKIMNNWSALVSLVFVLGLKHGLDADHLATIDGMARYHASGPRTRKVARWSGLLFSLGHGAVVMAVAGLVGRLPGGWQVPNWAQDVGAIISIGVLSLLGIVNLHAVIATPAHQHVRPVGVRTAWFGRLRHSGRPLAVVLIGALFAVSFDTLSLASLFALSAAQFGGTGSALLLGATFTFGMLLVDSLNGLWIARLLRRADGAALFASRLMGVAISAIALLVASFGAARYLMPPVAEWSDGMELLLGSSVIVMMGLAFVVAQLLSALARPGTLFHDARSEVSSSSSTGTRESRGMDKVEAEGTGM
jgi:high-affinity nickel-transport protein